MSSFQRVPAKERKISEIGPEDTRVSVVGTVVDSKGSTLAIDDGTGKINAYFENAPEVKPGQFVRIFGKPIALEDGMELQGEICHDFSQADIDAWRKVSRMWEESLKQL